VDYLLTTCARWHLALEDGIDLVGYHTELRGAAVQLGGFNKRYGLVL
jgi:beta-glucosidase/6-phospho-beta-glucosidase/beta-galactosidase